MIQDEDCLIRLVRFAQPARYPGNNRVHLVVIYKIFVVALAMPPWRCRPAPCRLPPPPPPPEGTLFD